MSMDKLISQEKTIRDLRGIKDTLVAAGDPLLASAMNLAIACVENQPAAEERHRTGKWKHCIGDYGPTEIVNDSYWFECNLCGRTSFARDRFCKNCGAYMAEEI